MHTVVKFTFPADEVALADTFRQLPDVRVDVEKSVGTCDDPVRLWVEGSDERAVREALDADPSVQAFRAVAAEDDRRWLFDVDIGPTVDLLQSVLLAEEGVILDATGHDGRWVITCRYAQQGSLTEVSDLLDERVFEYDLTRVQQVSETASAGADLSDDQRAALECACRKGYFEVPREATLADVADELGISHQALSERIRRGLAEYLGSDFPVEDGERRPEADPQAT